MAGARSCDIHGGKFRDCPTCSFFGLTPGFASTRDQRLRPCLRAMLAIVSPLATMCVCDFCTRAGIGFGVLTLVGFGCGWGWAGWLEISSGVALVVAGCAAEPTVPA